MFAQRVTNHACRRCCYPDVTSVSTSGSRYRGLLPVNDAQRARSSGTALLRLLPGSRRRFARPLMARWCSIHFSMASPTVAPGWDTEPRGARPCAEKLSKSAILAGTVGDRGMPASFERVVGSDTRSKAQQHGVLEGRSRTSRQACPSQVVHGDLARTLGQQSPRRLEMASCGRRRRPGPGDLGHAGRLAAQTLQHVESPDRVLTYSTRR